MDLTLECIRRHYAGEPESALADVLSAYADFFALFDGFTEFVDFFHFQDLVTPDYDKVLFFLPLDNFECPAVHIGGGDGGGVLAAWSVGSCRRHRCIMRPLVGPPCFQSGYSTQHCAIAYAAYPEPMAADGNSKRTLAGRVKAVYENLPLPPAVVAAMALDLLLARLRPLPLPGHRSVHRMAGAGLVAAGVGLNVWALAERRRRSAGTFDLERPEILVDSGPYAITRNPMYVGWWLIQLGAGSLAGSSWALALLPAELLVEHRYVLKEEAALALLFPHSYPVYAEKVPRYLGLPRT